VHHALQDVMAKHFDPGAANVHVPGDADGPRGETSALTDGTAAVAGCSVRKVPTTRRCAADQSDDGVAGRRSPVGKDAPVARVRCAEEEPAAALQAITDCP